MVSDLSVIWIPYTGSNATILRWVTCRYARKEEDGKNLRSIEPNPHRDRRQLPRRVSDPKIISQAPSTADHLQEQGRLAALPPQRVIGTANWSSRKRVPAALLPQLASGTATSSCWANFFVKPRRNEKRGDRWAVERSSVFWSPFFFPTGNIECGDRVAG